MAFLKDCRAFALSEAHLGAGQKALSMFGLIIGTGVAGAYVLDGALAPSRSGMGGEVGHMPLPYELIASLGLPLLPCGCGRVGCYETYCSGPGLARLSERILGVAVPGEELSGDDGAQVLEVWAAITAHLLDAIALTHDPDVIVLGGGVSNMPDITERLTKCVAPHRPCGPRSGHSTCRGWRPIRRAGGCALCARNFLGPGFDHRDFLFGRLIENPFGDPAVAVAGKCCVEPFDQARISEAEFGCFAEALAI